MTHELIDIGANLAHDSFDSDRDTVIRDAMDVGVAQIVITGSSEQSSIRAAELAAEMPGTIYATAGLHPHHASEYTDELHQTFADLHKKDEVVAVGECGLDYFRNFSPVEDQRRAFERQLELAVDSQLPVFLHERDAHEDYVAILEPVLPKISRAVAHCFTGTKKQLEKYIELGLYIGITGWICDERRGVHLQEIVGLIPEDRLLIETDAPYLLPRSLDPKPQTRRNEPKYLPEVLRVIARSVGRDEAEVARQTTENARRFFNLG